MKAKSPNHEEYTLGQLDEELTSFYEFCKESKLSDEEIQKICAPLAETIKTRDLRRKLRFAIFGMLLLWFLYYLTDFDAISWHLSAIGRIILIKALPFWNWQALKNEKCLIPNFLAPKQKLSTVFDCAVCEAIEKVDVVLDINPELLQSKYVRLDVPVILRHNLNNWPSFLDPKFNLTDAITTDNVIQNSIPCKLSTSTQNGAATVKKLLTNLKNFKNYFLHFQNCDFNTVKAFRQLSPRPEFLISEISPIQYNWLLMSRNYKVAKFKAIDLQEPITVIGQVLGSNVFRLIPRHNCETECPILEIPLKLGEALVFTTLWNLEYKPVHESENIAIILEAH